MRTITLTQLRRSTRQLLDAIESGESVGLMRDGKVIAAVVPSIRPDDADADSIRSHPAIGMWADRDDMKDPSAWVRNLRRPRRDVLIH